MVSGLNQADSKMQVTRTQVDNATATDYNVSNGVTMIGDSVNLRAQDYLTKAIPGIQIDAVVSRQLENGMKVFETDISNKVLLKNVVIALGTNTVSNYKELLDQYVEKLPKGRP